MNHPPPYNVKALQAEEYTGMIQAKGEWSVWLDGEIIYFAGADKVAAQHVLVQATKERDKHAANETRGLSS